MLVHWWTLCAVNWVGDIDVGQDNCQNGELFDGGTLIRQRGCCVRHFCCNEAMALTVCARRQRCRAVYLRSLPIPVLGLLVFASSYVAN